MPNTARDQPMRMPRIPSPTPHPLVRAPTCLPGNFLVRFVVYASLLSHNRPVASCTPLPLWLPPCVLAVFTFVRSVPMNPIRAAQAPASAAHLVTSSTVPLKLEEMAPPGSPRPPSARQGYGRPREVGTRHFCGISMTLPFLPTHATESPVPVPALCWAPHRRSAST
jgi:hypothetical protein